MWCIFYLFSVFSSGHWLNPSVMGPVLLIVLFQGRYGGYVLTLFVALFVALQPPVLVPIRTKITHNPDPCTLHPAPCTPQTHSAQFSEELTSTKYPLYTAYQHRVPKFIPAPWLAPMALHGGGTTGSTGTRSSPRLRAARKTVKGE